MLPISGTETARVPDVTVANASRTVMKEDKTRLSVANRRLHPYGRIP